MARLKASPSFDQVRSGYEGGHYVQMEYWVHDPFC